jgi:hypothetical protein
MCKMYTWRKAKHNHKRQTHHPVREVVTHRLLQEGFSKKKLVVSLKGLDAKMKWLAVNRQSENNLTLSLASCETVASQ